MTWAKFSDTWAEEPRVEEMSDAAFALYVTSVCYSARMMTEGRIPARKALTLRYNDDPAAVVKELVEAGFWAVAADGDYVLVSPFDHVRTNDEIAADRARKAQWARNKRAGSKGVDGRRDGLLDDRVDGQATVPSTRPGPTRPDPKGGPVGPGSLGVASALRPPENFKPPKRITIHASKETTR